MAETGWINDILHDFLKNSTYHLEENLPHLSEVIAEESESLYKKEKNKLLDEFLEVLEKIRDFVLESPIISGNIFDLKEAIDKIKEIIIQEIKKWEKKKK